MEVTGKNDSSMPLTNELIDCCLSSASIISAERLSREDQDTISEDQKHSSTVVKAIGNREEICAKLFLTVP